MSCKNIIKGLYSVLTRIAFPNYFPEIKKLNKNNKKLKSDYDCSYFVDTINELATSYFDNIIFGRKATSQFQVMLQMVIGISLKQKELCLNPNTTNFYLPIIMLNDINQEPLKKHININVNTNKHSKHKINILASEKIKTAFTWLEIDKIIDNISAQKINLILDELVWFEMLKECELENKEALYTLNKILSISNRIILISDGSNHGWTIQFYNKLQMNYKYEDNNVIKQIIHEKIQNKTMDSPLLSCLLCIKNWSPLENICIKRNFIDIFHYDNSYIYTNKYYYNSHCFSLSYTKTSELLFYKNKKLQEEFNNILSQVFTTKNMFIENNIDENKRNIIFIDNSLYTPELPDYPISILEGMPVILNETRSIIKKQLESFNQNDFNLIFKLHPCFTKDIANEYIKLIIPEGIKYSILDPKMPMETMIANEFYSFQKYGESFIFKNSTHYDPWEWTIYIGSQATSSAIHTMRIILNQLFDIPSNKQHLLLSFKNFIIPRYSHIVWRQICDNDNMFDYSRINLRIMLELYEMYGNYFDLSGLRIQKNKSNILKRTKDTMKMHMKKNN